MGARPFSAALVALATAASLFVACDTDAVGVETCRDIEQERCRAARYCDLGIETDEDVEKCERIMRDHCLHGLEAEEAPTSRELRLCVRAIQTAAECADDDGSDFSAAECGIDVARSKTTVCDVIQAPELAGDCEFLLEEPEEPMEKEDAGRSRDAAAD